MIDINEERDRRRAKEAINRLLEALSELVDLDSMPWPDRRDLLALEASEKQWSDLGEFTAWFADETFDAEEEETTP